MNISEWALKNRTVTTVLSVVMVVGGAMAYQGLGRLEDPEFTIKDALVVTPYTGASAAEVEEEVTDQMEIAIQQMSQLRKLESMSMRGMSNITVSIEKKYDRAALPQVWDELRRKVSDAQGNLPPGAGPSVVIDDYGDVFGILFVIHGTEYTYAEIKDITELLRREMLQVPDVAKVIFYGILEEVVYVELDRTRMAELGVTEDNIVRQLVKHNAVANAGRVQVGSEFLPLNPTKVIREVSDFENIALSGIQSDKQIYLRDLGQVRRGYKDPRTQVLRHDGHPAIGVGISTKSGGNVVNMGAAVTKRLEELKSKIPLGMEFGIINYQARDVVKSINNFVLNLIAAVAIVIVVLLLFMGLRSGLIIGFVLLQTILGSFIIMAAQEVALERISLGALIIALGMLVDNAIVVIDGMLVRVGKGEDAAKAAITVCKQTSIPLLGATVIAILAFAAIGTSDDSTGEFCRSLFTVVMISLGLSWVTAMTITPLLGVWFLKPPKPKAAGKKPKKEGGGFLGAYRAFVSACIRYRWLTVIVVIAMFGASMWGFKYVNKSFFPASTKPQFFLNLWAPEGTHLDDTEKLAADVEKHVLEMDGIKHVSTVVGQGPPRFVLTLTPEKANTAYAQLIIDVEQPERMTGAIAEIEEYVDKRHPGVLAYGALHELGPGSTGKVQARFQGPDIAVLRKLGMKTKAIFESDGNTKAVRTDWRTPVKVIRPVLAADQANLLGITRPDVAQAIKETFEGTSVTLYKERNDLLPVVLRAPEEWRNQVDQLYNMQIHSPIAGQKVPLKQVVTDFEVTFEDPIIMRHNRQRTFTVFADPAEGPATRLFDRVRPKVEALELPPGYTLMWDGEYLNSKDAQAPLIAVLPLFIAFMVLMCIALFNSVRHAAIIWTCVPLCIIGVTIGLLATGQPFGFMALLGALSLMGMLIKNVIVLLDEVDAQLRAGLPPFKAILESGSSRLRPVSMAAGTTAMGLIPLFPDAFFGSLAVTIVAGLAVATLLTVLFVPVLYAIYFRVKWEKPDGQAANNDVISTEPAPETA